MISKNNFEKISDLLLSTACDNRYNISMIYNQKNNFLTIKNIENGKSFTFHQFITNINDKLNIFNAVKGNYNNIDMIYNTYSKLKDIAYLECVTFKLDLLETLKADVIGCMTFGNKFKFSYNFIIDLKETYLLVTITDTNNKIGILTTKELRYAGIEG